MIDISKLSDVLGQITALANLGGAIVQAGAGVVAEVTQVLRSHGYDLDTTQLDELIADAERRRLLAQQEKDATS